MIFNYNSDYNPYIVVLCEDEEKHLYENLFRNYNKKVRPLKDPNDFVEVTVKLELQSIKTLVCIINIMNTHVIRVIEICKYQDNFNRDFKSHKRCLLYSLLIFNDLLFQTDHEQTIDVVGFLVLVSTL